METSTNAEKDSLLDDLENGSYVGWIEDEEPELDKLALTTFVIDSSSNEYDARFAFKDIPKAILGHILHGKAFIYHQWDELTDAGPRRQRVFELVKAIPNLDEDTVRFLAIRSLSAIRKKR
jgi:hypothetical protein